VSGTPPGTGNPLVKGYGMSMFSDMAQGAAWDDLVRVHGVAATYKSGGTGAGTAVTILFNRNQTIPGYYPDGEQEVEAARARAAPSEVASPGLTDTFTIGGEVWAVVAVSEKAGLNEMQLERRSQTYKSGGDAARIQR